MEHEPEHHGHKDNRDITQVVRGREVALRIYTPQALAPLTHRPVIVAALREGKAIYALQPDPPSGPTVAAHCCRGRAHRAGLAGGMYAQAGFYAQQSAAKAIKALGYLLDADPWRHSVQRLIAAFPQWTELPDLESWLDQGAMLDTFSIPTRYPNGLPDLPPGQVYRLDEARRGLEAAHTLVAVCQQCLEEHETALFTKSSLWELPAPAGRLCSLCSLLHSRLYSPHRIVPFFTMA